MKNLTWFQARDLAISQARAIRRDGWTYWLLYRGFVWLVSTTDAATHAETRRVATANDFRDSEFLAKDWTDELFTSGTYPPCTTPGPATALAASTSGASGAWTLTAGQCAGAGVGGGVPPTGAGGPPTPALTAVLTAYSDGFVTPIDHDSTRPVPFCAKVDWSVPAGVPMAIQCWYRPGFDVTAIPVSPLDGSSVMNPDGSTLIWKQTTVNAGTSGSFYFPCPNLMDAGAFAPSLTTGGLPVLSGSGPLVIYARVVVVPLDGKPTAFTPVLAHTDLSYRLWISGS